MKKFLTVLGGIFLVILVGGGGLIGYAAFRGAKLDAEAKTYVQATLPRVLSDPTSDNILSFMAPQDKGKINPAAMTQFYTYVTINLGAFQACDDLRGSSLVLVSPSGESTMAKYQTRCRFNKASVVATISLRKIGEAWHLAGVFFDTGSLTPASKANGASSQRI